jgi:hypothetical protein
VTAFTATTPPKRLVRSSVCRSALAMAANDRAEEVAEPLTVH